MLNSRELIVQVDQVRLELLDSSHLVLFHPLSDSLTEDPAERSSVRVVAEELLLDQFHEERHSPSNVVRVEGSGNGQGWSVVFELLFFLFAAAEDVFQSLCNRLDFLLLNTDHVVHSSVVLESLVGVRVL